MERLGDPPALDDRSLRSAARHRYVANLSLAVRARRAACRHRWPVEPGVQAGVTARARGRLTADGSFGVMPGRGEAGDGFGEDVFGLAVGQP